MLESGSSDLAVLLIIIIGAISLIYGLTTFAGNIVLGIIAIAAGLFLITLVIDIKTANIFARFLDDAFRSLLPWTGKWGIIRVPELKESITDSAIFLMKKESKIIEPCLKLNKNNRLGVEVSADDITDVYLVNQDALEGFQKGDLFSFIYRQERTRSTQFTFDCRRSGEFYLIVRNLSEHKTHLQLKLWKQDLSSKGWKLKIHFGTPTL
jgi:hypothetical protein